MERVPTKKAQGAFEFLLLVGIAFTASVIFLIASFQDIDELIQRKDYMMLRDQGDLIQGELFLALQVEDGYARSFEVPSAIGNRDFTITSSNKTITLTNDRSTYSFRIPGIEGNVTKGMNNLTREDGLVRVN
jgi:hypothetical protein